MEQVPKATDVEASERNQEVENKKKEKRVSDHAENGLSFVSKAVECPIDSFHALLELQNFSDIRRLHVTRVYQNELFDFFIFSCETGKL